MDSASRPFRTAYAAVAPVPARERIATLDVLRGIALLGVLVANVWLWFSGLWFRFPGVLREMRLSRGTADAVVHNALGVLVSGKALATFSFLFGLGMAVQMLRARQRGAGVSALHARRLAVLLAIGIVHTLLWYGDILLSYAVVGFALFLFRDREDEAVLACAVVLLFGVPLMYYGYVLAGALASAAPAAPVAAGGGAAAVLREEALAAFRSGAPAELVEANLRLWRWFNLTPAALPALAERLGLFLLGFYAGRREVFRGVADHLPLFRRLALWGTAAGLALALGSAVLLDLSIPAPGAPPPAPWLGPARGLLANLGTPLLALGYVAIATLLVHAARLRRVLDAFAPVGRMALTNYLSQTLICLTVFYGGGLGGRVGPAAGLGIALAVFAVQMAWSAAWLARYHFGPAEWAWRSLTYGRMQPMRIRPGGAAAPRPA